MRIIAGEARGKTIKAPKGMQTRPTTDRVREAIFSSLNPFLEDAVVLDAFGGSGALGLEAISRGAEQVVFCECGRQAQAAIRENIAALGWQKRTKLLCGATEQLLGRALELSGGFDIVLLDPPYNCGLIAKIEPTLLSEGFLRKEALVMLETAAKEPELFSDERWRLYKSRVYGDTAVYYYGLAADDEENE